MMGTREIFVLILLPVMVIYGCMILAFTFGLMKIMRRRISVDARFHGHVSVIIAVRNEEQNILHLLEGMLGQDFEADRLEVIVVDDHSEDATMNLARQFASNFPDFPLILVSSEVHELNSQGKKRAIERAVAVAKGDILLLTDADTVHAAGWISSMVSGFAEPAIQMVLGPVCFCHEMNLLQKFQSLEFLGLMGTTAGSAALGFPVMCNGANIAYRREAFYSSGGFRKNLQYASGDDQFIMSAVRKIHGNRALVFNTDPLSAVGTEPEATWRGFFNQRMRWVSKSKGYRDPVVIIVGMVTYLTHVLLAAGMALGILIPGLFIVPFIVWMVKIFVELPMVWIMARYFGKMNMMKYYIAAQLFQLMYVPLAGILGLVIPFKWKGRKS